MRRLLIGLLSIILLMSSGLIQSIYAASSAASPSTAVDDSSTGTATWTNPGNVVSSNDAYATATVDGTTSHYIKATGFGFSIPTNASIKGIKVDVERKSDKTAGGGSKDASVRLVKAGAIVGDDKATVTIYTTSDVTESHGGATDLWGTTWTPAEVNASNFGAVFAATKPALSAPPHVISVDVITISVYYNNPPTAVDDTASTAEDTAKVITAASLLANDTDADGDTLSITAVGNPVNGTVSLVGTNITFTPAANYNGSGATFEYTVSDGELTDTGLVTVTVTPVNDAPTISVTSPNGGNIFAGASPQTITWTAADVDGDTLTITLEYTTDGVSYTSIATGETNDGSFSWTVPSIDSTTVKVRATANDGTTTASDLSDANFTIDSTVPTGTISINSGATYSNSTSVTLTFTVSETIFQMELRNGTTGNFQTAITYESPHSYTLPAGDGSKTVAVRFTDSAGNKSVGAINDSIILDTTVPTDPTSVSSTSHAVSTPSSDTTIDMTWNTATDTTSGVDGYSYSFTQVATTTPDTVKDAEESATTTTSSALFDGSWYFHLRTRDNAGNWTSTVHAGPFIIDTTGPTIDAPTISPLTTDNFTGGTVTVSVTVTDTLSSVASVTFNITDFAGNDASCTGARDSGDPTLWSCQINTTALPDSSGGTYDLEISATDTPGNSSSDSYFNIIGNGFDLDNTAPSDPTGVVSSDHTVDAASTDTTITMTWTEGSDGGSGLDGYAYTFNNSSSSSCDQTKDLEEVVTTVTSSSLADGSWYFHICTVDNVGNWTSTVNVGPYIIDTTAPTGSWTSPASGSTVTGTPGLIVSASDATSGVASVAFSYRLATSTGSFTAIDTDLTSPYTAAWDTTTLTLDTYTLRAVVTDNAGNSTTVDRSVDVGAVVSAQVSNTASFTSIVVSWNTDRQTSGRVVYDTVSHPTLGDAPNYGYAFSTGEFDTSPKSTSHNIVIGGLSSGTLYYFRTISTGSPVTISEEKGAQTFSIPGAGSAPSNGGPAAALPTTATTGQVLAVATRAPLAQITQPVVFPELEEGEREEVRGITTPSQEEVPVAQKPPPNLFTSIWNFLQIIINFLLKLLPFI